MDFILKLGENGLVHGDFNEFNILLRVNKPDDIVVIDFPQMISIHHPEAENYFKRDVQCVKNFFIKKFNVTFEEDLKFEDIKQIYFLDEELKAYGYIKDKKIKNKKGNNSDNNKEENENEENLNNINDNENINEEPDEDNLDLGQKLDYEKEMIENMKNLKIEKEEDEKEKEKEKDKKNKKMTKEEIKNKVKKMLNKQNKVHVKEGKMGNRFKGKKDISNKMAIKNA